MYIGTEYELVTIVTYERINRVYFSLNLKMFLKTIKPVIFGIRFLDFALVSSHFFIIRKTECCID